MDAQAQERMEHMGAENSRQHQEIIGLKRRVKALERQVEGTEESMLDNKVELLQEDLECIHHWLDDVDAPREDPVGVLSIVGRMKILLKGMAYVNGMLDEVDNLTAERDKAVTRADKAELTLERRRRARRGKNGYGVCPLCLGDADADETDVGVGMMQTGPVFCPACYAYQNDNGSWTPGPQWSHICADCKEAELTPDLCEHPPHLVE